MHLRLLVTCLVLYVSRTLGNNQDNGLLLQAPWAEKLGWTPTTRACLWAGVECVGGDVVSL